MESQIRYQFVDLEELMNSDQLPERLDQEIGDVRERFASSVFEMVNDVQVLRYVRFHQYALVRLMDRITTPNSPNTATDQFYSQLENLLTFLSTDFKEFFDFDFKAPERQIESARRNAREHQTELSQLLGELSVDPKLIEALMHGLSRLEKRHTTISLKRISFAHDLQYFIRKTIEVNNGRIEEQLERVLYYLNCNSIKVFLYQTQVFERLVLKEDSEGGKLEKLALALKNVNQIQVKPGTGYNAQGTTLKELVSGYLNEEISYLERVRKPTTVHSFSDKALDFKLKLNLSVSQVAYVFRIFIENQFIQNKNQTELLKFLSKIVVTKKAENVSFDSLRAKYYNVEIGTKESVKEVLVSLIRYVDKS